MKQDIIKSLRIMFPFLLTIGLWRLSGPWWNPGGILAIIPMFYCTFIRPTSGFLIFSLLMCVALDYNFETVCFWVAMWCLFYAINGFQNLIDVTRMDFDGIFAFVVFLGLALLFQICADFSGLNILHAIWMLFLTIILYLPITTTIKRISK